MHIANPIYDSVFDQHRVTSDAHILNINEEDYPKKYREVTRRLQRAIAELDIKRMMDAEDDILEELQELEREIERKDKTIEEQDKIIKEQQETIKELRKHLQTRE